MLLSIEGEPVADLLARQFFLQQPPLPDWPDGVVLTYVVEREGRVITLAVPVRRHTIGEQFAGAIRSQGLSGLIQVAASTFSFFTGLMVFIVRPRHPAAHALLILGTSFLFNSAPVYKWTTAFFYNFRPESVPLDTWTLGINPSLMYLALTFPAAKWPLRRFPYLTTIGLYVWAPLAINTAYLLSLDDPPVYYRVANVVYVVQVLLLFGIVFGSLLHSAYRVHDTVARIQLKWVGLGLASFVLPGVGGWLVGFLIDSQSEVLYLVSVTGWFIMPICLAVAITRYRLFAIDAIIRRTLQYTILTALLGIVYFGSVVILQTLIGQTTGQQSPPILVFSTLIIAALFSPLRHRVQNVIDRRFYRKKYDAQLALARFAAAARNEMSPELLSAAMANAVQETVQPASVRIWLRPVAGRPQPTQRLGKDQPQPLSATRL
ncbi:MAG: hypothetical protein R3300_13120 [Candidatus Promineifilaceae bacterium]|nr:hypothetical protein [Candidatus Promineifilaceae bacterium]